MTVRFATAALATKFETENGDRHRTLAAMRKQGPAFVVGGSLPAEFDSLYAEEAAWLAANGISYTPSRGWHQL